MYNSYCSSLCVYACVLTAYEYLLRLSVGLSLHLAMAMRDECLWDLYDDAMDVLARHYASNGKSNNKLAGRF